jgi:predicted permease
MVVWRSVTPGYFRVLGIPIVRGRNFAEQDRNAAADLVILSESFARRLFPRGDAIGQRIRPSMSGPWRTVVGIAADVKNGGIEVPSDPEYYLLRKHTPEPVWQFPTSSFLLRTSLSPSATAEWVRHTVASLNPTLPVGIDTMSQRVGKLEERPRFNAALLGIFAAMGLLLAAVGIYGVAAFLVVQRTQEIGVRMALGAQRGQVVRLVAGKSLAPVAVGSLAGVVGALVLGRTMKSLLFGVRPHDPLTLVIAALALGGIAVVATLLPARRATKVNPATALHYE